MVPVANPRVDEQKTHMKVNTASPIAAFIALTMFLSSFLFLCFHFFPPLFRCRTKGLEKIAFRAQLSTIEREKASDFGMSVKGMNSRLSLKQDADDEY